MQNKAIVAIVGALLITSALQLTPKANAYTALIICNQVGTPNDPLPLNTPIECAATATTDLGDINDEINDLHIKVKDPDDNIVYQKDIDNWEDNGANDDDPADNALKHEFNFVVNKPGVWKIWAEFTNDTIQVIEIHVSLFVLPETPIGAIALIGSSIAIIGLFVYRKKQSMSKGTNPSFFDKHIFR